MPGRNQPRYSRGRSAIARRAINTGNTNGFMYQGSCKDIHGNILKPCRNGGGMKKCGAHPSATGFMRARPWQISVPAGMKFMFKMHNMPMTNVITINVKVKSTTSGNKYYVNDVLTPDITLVRGNTYTFMYAKSHPLSLSTTYDGIHHGAIEYTNDVLVSEGVTTIKVTQSTPNNLHYYCNLHAGMGGFIIVVDHNNAMHAPITHDESMVEHDESMVEHDESMVEHDDYVEHLDENICCKAMTAECLSCSEGITMAEYCKKMPELVGCKEESDLVTEPAPEPEPDAAADEEPDAAADEEPDAAADEEPDAAADEEPDEESGAADDEESGDCTTATQITSCKSQWAMSGPGCTNFKATYDAVDYICASPSMGNFYCAKGASCPRRCIGDNSCNYMGKAGCIITTNVEQKFCCKNDSNSYDGSGCVNSKNVCAVDISAGKTAELCGRDVGSCEDKVQRQQTQPQDISYDCSLRFVADDPKRWVGQGIYIKDSSGDKTNYCCTLIGTNPEEKAEYGKCIGSQVTTPSAGDLKSVCYDVNGDNKSTENTDCLSKFSQTKCHS